MAILKCYVLQKIKIAQTKNPKFSAQVFRFSIFSFYKATFRVYNTNTVYYIYKYP